MVVRSRASQLPRARLCAGSAAVVVVLVLTHGGAADVEWRSYGGDKAATRYSPLSQINRDNVTKLQIAWRRTALDAQFTTAFPDLNPTAYLRSTPIIVDNVLYAPNAVGLIEAFNPGTGKTVWVQEPFERGLQGVAGQNTRGVEFLFKKNRVTWAKGRARKSAGWSRASPG